MSFPRTRESSGPVKPFATPDKAAHARKGAAYGGELNAAQIGLATTRASRLAESSYRTNDDGQYILASLDRHSRERGNPVGLNQPFVNSDKASGALANRPNDDGQYILCLLYTSDAADE